MTASPSASTKGFGTSSHPQREPQTPQFQSVQEWDDRFLALFPHRYDYIWADHPRPEQKPSWQTESRHPLSDRLIKQGSYLYGVRFGRKTHYILLDIDISSLYHPQQDPFAISRLVGALEPLGLVQYVACTSSYSGGIHLYFPFEVAQDSYEMARVVQVLLENAGFIFSPGHLELFPNDRGFVDGIPALYAAHRLPMQAGSYLLDRYCERIWSDQTTFVQHWHFAQYHNQVSAKTLQQLLKTASRKKYRISGKASKFLNDLLTEIYQGWTGSGQTNRLLGRIALYCYIFWHYQQGCAPLEGGALVRQIVEIARSLPGYTEFCRHQHEIEQRAEEWANCVESSRYFPYGTGKTKPVQSQEQAQRSPTWHEGKQEEARARIQQAIAQLLETDTLPAKPTARFYALVQQGIGGSTLYKHKDLWHPNYLLAGESEAGALREAQAELIESSESPPHPPDLASERTEGAPECPSLLEDRSSNTPLGKLLSEFQYPGAEGISSNTQLEAKALQDYRRAAQQEAWQRQQQRQQRLSLSEINYVAQRQRWLELGDEVLSAEAKAFFDQRARAESGSDALSNRHPGEPELQQDKDDPKGNDLQQEQ